MSEARLVELGEILGADRFEVVDEIATFYRLGGAHGMRWSFALGTRLHDETWDVTAELAAETSGALVA